MAIKAPKWAPKAFPTSGGWCVKKAGSPQKPELVKSATITAEQIAEWHAEQAPAPVVAEAPAPQMLNEAPSNNRPLYDSEIEHYYNDVDEAVDNSFTD